LRLLLALNAALCNLWYVFRIQVSFESMLCSSTNSRLAGLRGQMYERYVHRHFLELSERRFQVKRLLPSGVIEDAEFTFPRIVEQTTFAELAALPAEAYGVPGSKTYTAVHAVKRPNIALQMAVTNHPGYDVATLRAVREGLQLAPDVPLHLFLVTPADVNGVVRQAYYERGRVVLNPHSLCAEQYWLTFPWVLESSEPSAATAHPVSAASDAKAAVVAAKSAASVSSSASPHGRAHGRAPAVAGAASGGDGAAAGAPVYSYSGPTTTSRSSHAGGSSKRSRQ